MYDAMPKCPICGSTMIFHLEYFCGTPHVWYDCPIHGSPVQTYYATTGTDPYYLYRHSSSGVNPIRPAYTINWVHNESTTNI